MQITVPVSDLTKLLIKLFVIGYKEQGESVIMLFFDQGTEKVVYSMVIDSCLAEDGTSKTVEILDKWKVGKLNILCWTHPDTDHTLGIDYLIDTYCDHKTKFLIPSGLYGRDGDPIDYNDGDQDRIKNLYNYNTARTKSVIPVGPMSKDKEELFDVIFDDLCRQLNVQIIAMSPHKDYIAENFAKNNKIAKNHLSISLMVKVGDYKFDFCGDITSRTINNIWKEPFVNPLFLKTPHHSSRYSLNLLDILAVDQNSLGCTTTFRREGLPHDDAISKYKDCIRYFHSTGTTSADSPIFGMIEYSFDLFDKKEVRIKCHGHAHKVGMAEE